MDSQYLGKRVTHVDGGLSGPIIIWNPDILLRLRDFCESPGLFVEGEISGGYVRDMLRDARDEIIRLRLTDAERDALGRAAGLLRWQARVRSEIAENTGCVYSEEQEKQHAADEATILGLLGRCALHNTSGDA